MMRALGNKKNMKITSFVVAAMFILGIGGLAYTQMATPAMASATSTVGIVDMTQLFNENSPQVVKATAEMQALRDEVNKEYSEKAPNLDEAGLMQLQTELQKRMSDKDTELRKGMQDEVESATKAVADAKGLTVVLDKAAVLYGGVDITEQVTKKLNGDASSDAKK